VLDLTTLLPKCELKLSLKLRKCLSIKDKKQRHSPDPILQLLAMMMEL